MKIVNIFQLDFTELRATPFSPAPRIWDMKAEVFSPSFPQAGRSTAVLEESYITRAWEEWRSLGSKW